MKNIKKWLLENNFKYRDITLTEGTVGLMVDTNYQGLYPTKESLNKIRLIENKCKRFKKIKTETRGHYTAVLITEV